MAENNGVPKDRFRRFCCGVSSWAGAPWSFGIAIFLIVGWAVMGPFFHYSNTWQLVINTATTIITFLMVFLIQNTQNRDAKAIHLKLDELIRSTSKARNILIELQNMSDEELTAFQKEFEELGTRAKLRQENRLKTNGAAKSPQSSEENQSPDLAMRQR